MLDKFRHETRFVIRLVSRDVFKRLSALILVLGLCWVAGERWSVLLVAAVLLACEASARLLARAEPPPDHEVSTGLAAWMWVTCTTSTFFFVAPGLLLADHPDLPVVLGGFVWMFGVFVYISNSYVALPLYNWSQMIPAFTSGFVTLGVAAATHGSAGGHGFWVVTLGLFVVYCANTVETMTTQKEFHRDLEQARAQAKARLDALEHLTRHDPLTGLLNRQAFDARLAGLLAQRRTGRVVAIFLMDLDGFKPINDTYSHAAGDAVLVAVAHRLAALAGEEGLAARLGGDEFALAVPGLVGREAAIEFANRIIAAVGQPIAHEGKVLTVSASVGVALSGVRPPPGQETEAVTALCAGADQAMLRAKAMARTAGHLAAERRPVLYLAAEFPPRASLEDRNRLSAALADRSIRPDYEPIVDLESRRVIGFEALARWNHPLDRPTQPAGFIPLITELGLQGDFLSAMASQVLEDVAALVDAGLDPGRVSLNIPEIALATRSGRDDLDRLLAAHPQARPHVVFEITEDVFIARSAETIQGSIAHFRAQGVGISLDDFGTGFASFQHLRQLDFDEIKIDSSFVSDLGRDPAAEILVGGFVSMIDGLGARLIAEGIETEAQRCHLLRLGCRLGQGFLFGRALPFDETRARLAAEPVRPLAPDGACPRLSRAGA